MSAVHPKPRTGRSGKGNADALARRLNELRTQRNLSLTELAERTGIARSMLYKVENSGVSLTYGKLLDLAQGLGVDVAELFQPPGPSSAAKATTARRSISRFDRGDVVETGTYRYVYLCNDLRRKQMIPTTIYLKARTLEEFGPLIEHPGEEFTVVLEGAVQVVTEHYEPAVLTRGDVLYMDSTMGHAYLKASKEDAVVITLCCGDAKPEAGVMQIQRADNKHERRGARKAR